MRDNERREIDAMTRLCDGLERCSRRTFLTRTGALGLAALAPPLAAQGEKGAAAKAQPAEQPAEQPKPGPYAPQ